jgi:hypothetical protein
VAVGDAVELAQRGPQVQPRRDRPAPGAQALDGPHDLGVQAQAGVDDEVPVTGRAQADDPMAPHPQRVQDASGGVDRISRQAERAGEHVRVPARQGGQGRPLGGGVRAGRGRRRAHDPVDRLVDRAVTAQRDQQLVAVRDRGRRQGSGMAPVACLHDV